jgi:pimeloyl-ACP methyl ester carboxylesterase
MGEEANVVDFDEAALARFYAGAIPVPEQAITTPVELHDERRLDVPATLVCPEYTAEDLEGWVRDGEAPVAELTRIKDVGYVDLPGGHWPQLTQPEALARVILDAAGEPEG